MVGRKEQGGGMRVIISICMLLLFFVFACEQENQEPKYSEHQAYPEFLDFLRHETKLMSTDFEKTSFIRRKVAELIDGGVGGRDVALFDENWVNWKGERYYSVFLFDSATVRCGGSAHFLHEVYSDLGYNSETFDIGFENTFYTHQFTVVYSNEISDYYVQDPFFNISFLDKHTSDPLPFSRLLNLVFSSETDRILIKQDHYSFSPDWDWSGIEKYSGQFEIEVNEEYSLRNYQAMSSIIDSSSRWEGYNTRFIELYKYPLDHNSKTIMEFYYNVKMSNKKGK
ncbi:hypothetical protein GCM10009118_32740 [Wandonia haliotis]|uniref:Uncharacterized protein n=2 Tax=Wandonia haliotis TaxID=574963 RepID=A0ABP3Y9M4_9FLAO